MLVCFLPNNLLGTGKHQLSVIVILVFYNLINLSNFTYEDVRLLL